jgi:hypothetical protein
MGHRQAYTSNESVHRKTAKQSAMAEKKFEKLVSNLGEVGN